MLILAAGDSPEQLPLEAAGADLARCHLIEAVLTAESERPVVFPRDIPFIEQEVLRRGAKLVVVDPLMAFIQTGVDTNSDADSRQVLTAFKLMAERTGAAVLLLRHLNRKTGESAIYRGGGSIAFTAAARVAMCVGPHPEDADRLVLAVVKLNVARKPPALAYSTADRNGVPASSGTARSRWTPTPCWPRSPSGRAWRWPRPASSYWSNWRRDRCWCPPSRMPPRRLASTGRP